MGFRVHSAPIQPVPRAFPSALKRMLRNDWHHNKPYDVTAN